MILLKVEIMCDALQRRTFPTGCDELAVAADRQRHEDQEYSSPPSHCKCNDPGILVFVSVLILAMIQDQALVASKHYLIETNENSPGDKQEDNGWEIFVFLKDFSVLVVCPYLASPKISL